MQCKAWGLDCYDDCSCIFHTRVHNILALSKGVLFCYAHTRKQAPWPHSSLNTSAPLTAIKDAIVKDTKRGQSVSLLLTRQRHLASIMTQQILVYPNDLCRWGVIKPKLSSRYKWMNTKVKTQLLVVKSQTLCSKAQLTDTQIRSLLYQLDTCHRKPTQLCLNHLLVYYFLPK